MYEILPNSQVLQTETLTKMVTQEVQPAIYDENGELVTEEIEEVTSVVKTHYDMEYHVKLSVDKPEILADGVDVATITAAVYNYLDEPQTLDTVIDIRIVGPDFDASDSITTVSGLAFFEFDSLTPGKYTITARAVNYRDGSVTVNAV